MLNTLIAFVLATSVHVVPAPASVAADTTHCRVTAVKDAKARRCSVAVPNHRVIKACTPADASADRCDKRGGRKFVAWVAASKGAKCKVSRKHSDWTKHVVVRMSEKTPAGSATCDLYVVLR